MSFIVTCSHNRRGLKINVLCVVNILQVSDDEESPISSRSRQTGNDDKVKFGNDGVGGRGGGDIAETGGRAVNFSEPVGGGEISKPAQR